MQGMKMGRPLKYTQEYIEKEADIMTDWFKIPGNIYFIDFVVDREYGPEYISIFSKENHKFSQACARAKLRQESHLMKAGLSRTYDSSFCKFTMQNVCKWSDKQTVVHETTESAIHPSANNTSADLINDPIKSL